MQGVTTFRVVDPRRCGHCGSQVEMVSGENAAKAREAAGLTRETLATLAGVTADQVRNGERGISRVKPEVLRVLGFPSVDPAAGYIDGPQLLSVATIQGLLAQVEKLEAAAEASREVLRKALDVATSKIEEEVESCSV